MRILLIGGTGPTGPLIVDGLLGGGHDVTVLHRGTHEARYRAEIEHIHTDPHFIDPLRAGVSGRKFDIVIATYGRLRYLPEVLDGVTDRLVTVGAATYAFGRSSQAAVERSPRLEAGTLFRRIVDTEAELMEAHRAGRFAVTHLRYPHIYGPRQPAPREWSIIRRLRDGRPTIPVVEAGLMLQSKAFAKNAAAAVLACVGNDASFGRAYNVTDSFTYSDGDWIRAIAGYLGVEVEIFSVPASLGLPHCYWGADVAKVSLGDSSVEHDLISSDAIREELSYRDAATFDEALRETVDWYLENPPEPGGEAERQLLDQFDYAAEDALIERLRKATRETIHEGRPPAGEWRHAYEHPTSSGE